MNEPMGVSARCTRCGFDVKTRFAYDVVGGPWCPQCVREVVINKAPVRIESERKKADATK